MKSLNIHIYLTPITLLYYINFYGYLNTLCKDMWLYPGYPLCDEHYLEFIHIRRLLIFKLKVKIRLVKVMYSHISVLPSTAVTVEVKYMRIKGCVQVHCIYLLPSGWKAKLLMGPKCPFTRPISSSKIM